MNGKHATVATGGPRRATHSTLMMYDNGQSVIESPKRDGVNHVALLRGTMLELVRRDGRDLTARQLTTLLTVYLHDDVHSVSSLAKMLNISRPGVTRILDRLVEAELVSRAEDAADRRRVLVHRTPEGARYMRDLDEVAGQVAADLAAGEPKHLS